MIDERSRRREDFNDVAVPVAIGEWGVFYLPKPWVQLRAKVVDGRPVAVLGRSTFGPDFDAMLEEIREEDDPWKRIELSLGVAVFMLRLNYDLADAELEDVTTFHLGNPDDARWLTEVLEVATGIGPKRSPGGIASP